MELSSFSTVTGRKRVCAPALWACTSSTLPVPYQGALQHLADRPEVPCWWRPRQRRHSVPQATTKSPAPFSNGSILTSFSPLSLMKQKKLFFREFRRRLWSNCTMGHNLPPLSFLVSSSQQVDEPVGRCLALLCHTIEQLSIYILKKYKQYKNL